MLLAILSVSLCVNRSAAVGAVEEEPVVYGTDISFPMHYARVSDNYAWLPHNVDPSIPTPDRYKGMAVQVLSDMQSVYDESMEGCHKTYDSKYQRCASNERDRIAMNLRQPRSMTNYTEIGFKKIMAPKHMFDLISDFWEKNKDGIMDDSRKEQWPAGNTYTNHWKAPTYITSVENSGLRGGGSKLKQKLWDAARETIQEWTGEELTQCSLYGIRTYSEGSILASHVDRLPLVSSAIINVAQDVDEPWPIEVIGHDGKAHNVTMNPGEMILYESHSVIHGRPFPLKGRYYANIFVHFEPTGHSLRHNAKDAAPKKDVHHEYTLATARGMAGHEASDETGLPPYVMPGTPEEKNWRASHPDGYHKDHRSVRSFATGSMDIHKMAGSGDLEGLKMATKGKKKLAEDEDSNGWMPIHEAARGGQESILQYLLGLGVDQNARTNHGTGGSALYLAIQGNGKTSPAAQYLEKNGAVYIEPEL